MSATSGRKGLHEFDVKPRAECEGLENPGLFFDSRSAEGLGGIIVDPETPAAVQFRLVSWRCVVKAMVGTRNSVAREEEAERYLDILPDGRPSKICAIDESCDFVDTP